MGRIRPFYRDRRDAGQNLADALRQYAGAHDVVVLGLPRGGVPVAYEVAQALGAPLDIFMVRKLGLPGHEELAMGAIATGGVVVWNQEVLDQARPSRAAMDAVIVRERQELTRREAAYRGKQRPPELKDRTIILIDDGLATGASMRAAAAAVRELAPRKIVVAVPVAAAETCVQLRAMVDDVVCPETPEPFMAVGLWYYDFSPTTDEEVHELMERAGTERKQGAAR